MRPISDPAAPYGARAELLQRLGQSLAFARLTVEAAEPSHPVWKVDLGQVSGFEKMMMEAGLLAYLVGRTGLFEPEIEALARAIRAKYESGTTVACILRHPRLAASLGTLLLVLDRFGLATAQEQAAVRAAFDSPYVECTEHVPFRLLDRRWVAELARGTVDPLAEALALSTACRIAHPIYMSREDGYAITHSIMYATDFGARAAPSALRDDRLWATIDAAIAWTTGSGDFDLLAELLLSQLYLRGRLSPYGAIAWRRCRESWDALGFLPSPSLSADSFSALADEAERRQYAFHNMYHTMLVGGLLSVALLDQRCTPAEGAAPDPVYVEPASVEPALQGAAAHLERVFGISGFAARETIAAIAWVADDSALDDLTRQLTAGAPNDAVAERMAVDASIILAAQDYRLPQLAAALRRAGRSGMVTPTVSAGADFLARQSLVNGAIGAGWLAPSGGEAPREDIASARATAALANCLLDLGERLASIRVAA